MPDDIVTYQPIRITNSDGQASNPVHGTEVPRGSPRYLMWCRALGQMLMEGFDAEGRFKGQHFTLDELPSGYELREVPRSKPAGRANPDVYLHGRTSNPAHKYRSMQEFLPHLVWLASNGSVECPCKLCKTLRGRTSVTKPKAKVQEGKGSKDNGPANVASEAPQTTTSTHSAAPISFSTSRTREQELDSEPNGRYLYRPGELVWFNKNKWTWGLAVISIRRFEDGMPRYYLQPLSHPHAHPPPERKDQEHLRPWLAWSVPLLGNKKLQNLTYNQVSWAEELNNYPGDPVVDGSILAAGAIDASYSLFEQDKSALSITGEKFYRGLFLGAEKIWAGEPVRLRVPGEETCVMVVRKIIEAPVSPSRSDVALYGDVYVLTKMPTPIAKREIPPRMEADLKFRNHVERAAETGLWYDWRIVEPNAKKGLEFIMGRWYEAETMLPILRGPEKFKEDIENGVAGDAGMFMNGRGDIKAVNVRMKDRLSTFGPAVPAGFKVSRGLDANRPDEFSGSMEIDG